MGLFFDYKILLLVVIWIVVFLLAIRFLKRIKSPIAKSINPMMVVMPISFVLSDRIIGRTFYFSYLIYFLIAWLIIGLVMFLFSVRRNSQTTTVQQFWLTYWRASSLIAIIFLILSVILAFYQLLVG